MTAQQTEDAEVTAFFAAHQGRIRGFLIQACGCAGHEADGVVQDTAIEIRKSWRSTVRDLEKPEAYWYKIAKRRFQRIQGARAQEYLCSDPHEQLPPGALPDGLDKPTLARTSWR